MVDLKFALKYTLSGPGAVELRQMGKKTEAEAFRSRLQEHDRMMKNKAQKSEELLLSFLRENRFVGVNDYRKILFKGTLPLQAAVKQNNVQVVVALLKAGADP